MRSVIVPLREEDRSSSVTVASMLALMDRTGTISQELLPVHETESEQRLSQFQVQQPISLLLPDHLLFSLKSRRCEAFFQKKIINLTSVLDYAQILIFSPKKSGEVYWLETQGSGFLTIKKKSRYFNLTFL